MKISMKHWWNDSDRWKRKHSETSLSQCHFIHHVSHMGLIWGWIRASAMRGRRLTDCCLYFSDCPEQPNNTFRLEDVGALYGDAMSPATIWTCLGLGLSYKQGTARTANGTPCLVFYATYVQKAISLAMETHHCVSFAVMRCVCVLTLRLPD